MQLESLHTHFVQVLGVAMLSAQVNTGAAEVLYSAVGEWAQLDQDSTVLDVCCGTGTIGISLAKVRFDICRYSDRLDINNTSSVFTQNERFIAFVLVNYVLKGVEH